MDPRGMYRAVLVMSSYVVVLLLFLTYMHDSGGKHYAPEIRDEDSSSRLRGVLKRETTALARNDSLVNVTVNNFTLATNSSIIKQSPSETSQTNSSIIKQSPSEAPRTVSTTPETPVPDYVLLDTNTELDFYCHSCSLVFSSGHLKNSSMGEAIDSADCVFRQNTATVRGFEKDVGTRTTLRIIGHVNLKKGLVKSEEMRDEILSNATTRASIVFVPWLYKEKINSSTHEVYKLARNFSTFYPHVKFCFQHEKKMNKMEKLFLEETGVNRTEIETWFSTGFLSLQFALDRCDHVIAYGLSDAEYCSRDPNSTVPYHYYDYGTGRECDYIQRREKLMKGGHKFLTERIIFARWALNQSITFQAPSWPQSAFNLTSNFSSPYLNVYKKTKADGSFDRDTIRKRVAARRKVFRRIRPAPKPRRPAKRIYIPRRHIRPKRIKR